MTWKTHFKEHLVHARAFLTSLAVLQVTWIANHPKLVLAGLRSFTVDNRIDPDERLLHLHETDVEVLGPTAFEPALRRDDPLDLAELRIWASDRLLARIADIRLDFSRTAKTMTPIVAAVTGGHENIRLDQPACAHRPFAGLLELVVDEKLDNSSQTSQHP